MRSHPRFFRGGVFAFGRARKITLLEVIAGDKHTIARHHVHAQRDPNQDVGAPSARVRPPAT